MYNSYRQAYIKRQNIMDEFLDFSRYKNSLEDNMSTLYEGKSREDLYKSFTTISEKTFKAELSIMLQNHSLKAGVEASRYYFTPGNSRRTKSKETESGYLLDTIVGFSTPFSANEAALYAEDDICFGNNFYANIGLRGVVFTNEGTSYLKAGTENLHTCQAQRLCFVKSKLYINESI